MLEILSYDFFRNALIAGLLISLISGVLWSLVVLRKEVNITHAISHILFLWIVISLFFAGNYYVFWMLSALVWSCVLFLLERYSKTSRESTKEILSQVGLAGGIFFIGFLWNLQIDIFNFLFGSILFVSWLDISLLLGLAAIWAALYYFFGKKLLRSILSPDIARSQWIALWRYEFVFLLYLSLFIAVSVKIFWVLLLGAFLVLPSNTGKVLAKSMSHVVYIATICSLIGVVWGLFASYYLDTSAGASIVLILWAIYFLSLFKR